MDVSACPFKSLLKDHIKDLEVIGIRDQCDPLLEEVEGRVSEAGLIRGGSSLPTYILKEKFGERDQRNDVVVRRDRSTDKSTFPSVEYQPIVDVWDTDAEEEHLISQRMPQRSHSKDPTEISNMDARKSLLGHQTSSGTTRAALYTHEELIDDGASEQDKLNGYNSGLSECFRKVKYCERDGKRNNEMVRGVHSLDRVTTAEYRPIEHVRDSDSEEEDLVSHHLPKKSNGKVKSIVEACRQFLGFSL